MQWQYDDRFNGTKTTIFVLQKNRKIRPRRSSIARDKQQLFARAPLSLSLFGPPQRLACLVYTLGWKWRICYR